MIDINKLFKKLVKKSSNIACLKKIDLHIHTPASKDYIWKGKKTEEDAEYEIFINRFIETDLDAIAITDHNTIDGYIRIKDIIFKNKEIGKLLKNKIILPGVEITCFSRHFLIYFSENEEIYKIKEFLIKCGIEDKYGDENVSADRVTPLTLCELAEKYGAIVILPHADSEKGFLRDYIKNLENSNMSCNEFKLTGGIVEKVLRCNNLLGICIKNEGNRERIRTVLGNFNKNIKIFNASDSHSAYNEDSYIGAGKAMGTEFFYANMGKISFRTLRLFLSNPNTKVIEEKKEKFNTYILGCCFKGGFIKDKNNNEWAIIPFSKELNCFIGARGTGKSTIIDIIKYVYNFYDIEQFKNSEFKDDIYVLNELDDIQSTEEKTIISRFDEVAIFIVKGTEHYCMHLMPDGFNTPNVTIYKNNGKEYKSINTAKKLKNNNMIQIKKFIYDVMPVIYQQKNILDIGNSKIKLTNTIYQIIRKVLGEDYIKLIIRKQKLQGEINDICNEMVIERKKDSNADLNTEVLIKLYNEFLEISLKINDNNIEVLNKIDKILGRKLNLKYELIVYEKYINDLIYQIVNQNRYKNNISYSEELCLEKDLRCLLSKISDLPNLIYLLFTYQYKEISQKTGFSEEVTKQACELSYRYIQGNLVSCVPQIVIDFELNVNYGSKNKDVFVNRNNLSFGQRAVGILMIILYGTTLSKVTQPIILDQPEDDLDNSYIYHTLVKELSNIKEKRQLIIATHSPNIAVAGNSENVLVLKGNGENGWLECNGTIDTKEVSKEAIDVLEGNDIVFKERAELYGLIL